MPPSVLTPYTRADAVAASDAKYGVVDRDDAPDKRVGLGVSAGAPRDAGGKVEKALGAFEFCRGQRQC